MTAPDGRLCLALDVADAESAARWVARTRHCFGVYKIGLELFCGEGPGIVEAVRRAGAEQIFLDLKLHDIPNTVRRAVARLRALGVDLLTIHTGGGLEMMQAAEAESGSTRLLGVTVLTSLDAEGLVQVGAHGDPGMLVRQRAQLAMEAGLGGLVCSALEVRQVREATGSAAHLVTPGIRLAGGASGDQRRVADPRSALAAGADLLVIGRAVTAADDPEVAMSALLAAVQGS